MANIASCKKEIYGERLFQRPKEKKISGEDNVNKRGVKVFVRITSTYVIKFTDKLLSLR